MVIELCVVQFWSEIMLVISNQTRAARSFDFEITRMISDQIALHSVQLPLFTAIKSIKFCTVIPKCSTTVSSFDTTLNTLPDNLSRQYKCKVSCLFLNEDMMFRWGNFPMLFSRNE